MKILIADDDPVSRRLLETTLRKMGHEVTAVADGRAACDVLLSPGAPRLAILDWMMPELDGLAVCRALRERKGPYVYVILLTSRGGREDLVAGLAAQADDFLTKPFDLHELEARIQSGQRILELQEGLLCAQSALQHEATHDRLTGLWNRGRVIDHVNDEFVRAQETGGHLTLALVDIDYFKAVNDNCGHIAGDRVLRIVAERMQAALRETDAIGRYGGEEFLIVLGHGDGLAEGFAAAALDRIRRAASAASIEVRGGTLTVTVSVGAITVDPRSCDAAAAIAAADRALYRAKADGRNCLRIADPSGAVENQESSVMTPRRSAYSTMSV